MTEYAMAGNIWSAPMLRDYVAGGERHPRDVPTADRRASISHAYLYNLLTDELGLNLRNVIAHGLRDRVGQADAALLIQAACYLRSLGFGEREG